MNKGKQATIKQIERECGRINKSIFVISDWILQANSHIKILSKHDENKKIEKIYNSKDKAIKHILETELMDIKIYKPNDNNFYWLYVLTYEAMGLKVNLVVPYNRFRKIINKKHDKLELTDVNKDGMFLNGKELNYRCKFKLNFILENLGKSRVKLISKLSEINQ